MSRFFAQGNETSSDSDSSEEEVKEIQRKPTFNYSSDEENVKRVVKSPKAKYHAEVKTIIQFILNKKKINDFPSLLTKFDEFLKCYTKAENSLSKTEIMPGFVIRFLANLHQYVCHIWQSKEDTKKLTKLGYKALTSLRQKLRKFNKNYENDINLQLQNGTNGSDYDLSDDSADNLKIKNESVSREKLVSDSDSISSDDERDIVRDSFLKKSTNSNDAKKRERKEKKEREASYKDDEDENGQWETVKNGSNIPISKQNLFEKDDDVSVTTALNKYKDILNMKNHKRSEKRLRIQLLRELLGIVITYKLGLGLEIKIRLSEISSILDFTESALEAMKSEYWSNLLVLLKEMSDILFQNADSVIIDDFEDENEELSELPFKIKGSLSSLTERLIDEFYKILKHSNHFSSEYVDKLKDEPVVVHIIDNILKFLECHDQVNDLCRVKVCKIESFYYKIDKNYFNNVSDRAMSEAFDKHCKYVYNNDATQRLRTRTILAQVYHKALHDNWYEARDLMLMSNLQLAIQHADVSTQILYNRTMAQLGLCAFRHGLIEDANNCLSDMMSSGRVKELLGQGFTLQRNNDRSLEQEQRDRMYQVPFHLSIHVELLECTYLISAMLINIPKLAAQELDAKRRLISKAYYQVLRSNEKLSLNGPPETMREFIVAASRSLKAAKWRECVDYLFNQKMKAKVWCLISQPTAYKDKLVEEIKKQSLKSYIFAYAVPVYNTINLKMLSDLFEMTESQIQSTLSGMILENELEGSLELHSNTFVLKKNVKKNYVQILSHQLTDKLTTLMDHTERVSERSILTSRFQRYARAGD